MTHTYIHTYTHVATGTSHNPTGHKLSEMSETCTNVCVVCVCVNSQGFGMSFFQKHEVPVEKFFHLTQHSKIQLI